MNLSATVKNWESTEIKVIVSWRLSHDGKQTTDGSMGEALPPKGESTISFPEAELSQPKLWWPNGIFDTFRHTELYSLEISITEQDSGLELDREVYNVGIRSITSEIDSKTGGRLFHVNGNKVFINGANWISIDSMMRFNKTKTLGEYTNWYEEEIRMHAEMNMNMIRVWGGGIMER